LGFISPVIAKIAREHNVDLKQITGGGAGGRITKKDILAYIESSNKAETPIWETPADGDVPSNGIGIR
jgi:pyruvate/2-oxoglutarate dehydrogenase complex dihydrolipoamide acyltransferase (E2) component